MPNRLTESDLTTMEARPRPCTWDPDFSGWDPDFSGYECEECGAAMMTDDGMDPSPICHGCAQRFAAEYPAAITDRDRLIAEVRQQRREMERMRGIEEAARVMAKRLKKGMDLSCDYACAECVAEKQFSARGGVLEGFRCARHGLFAALDAKEPDNG